MDEKEKKNSKMRDQEQKKENYQKEIASLTQQMIENEQKFKEQQKIKRELIQEKSECRSEIETRKKELTEQSTKNTQLEKRLNKVKNSLRTEQEAYQQTTQLKEIAKNNLAHLEKEVLESKKFARDDMKLLEELRKAREQMNKDVGKADVLNKRQGEHIVRKEDELKQLEGEILTLRKQQDEMEKSVGTLEKEKEKYGIQASQANAKYFHALEEIKLKDNLISEFQKKNIETENKLKEQQKLYEQVRSEKNIYSKQVTETEDEIAEIKKRQKIVNHQISQLKEEKDAKEVALAKESFEHKKKEKWIEKRSIMLEKQRKEIQLKEEQMKNLYGESEKFTSIFRQSEQQRNELKKEYENIVSERDILGTQLIRRNDESALLYEKIKIQEGTLANGEAEYRERMSDINLLNIKIQDLQREKRIVGAKASQVPKLKGEVNELEKDLILEKTRVKALSEELENPMNQERFRRLEGTDPDSYEMSNKIQTLQRRLIAKTEEVVEKEVILQQKEKNIQELREIMKRQPGIEEAKMISHCQQELKKRTRAMKAMAAELNMNQADVNKYKYEIEKINKEIQEMTRKYNEHKKRMQIEKEYYENQALLEQDRIDQNQEFEQDPEDQFQQQSQQQQQQQQFEEEAAEN
eukprot:TRINITY_DN11593_c0_g1_i1.p1 TRINITY_DN11593_c0_g1~~TRINITY_DN11593_c0_g1_i1.p1  ORF type:complete len:720 (-),score=184.60 TRINITY_DN11593_c0_g1_i1:201-2111(-)